jgi:hypothetical protein
MNMNSEIETIAISSKTILHYCKYHPGGLCRPQGLTKTRPQDNPRQMVKGEKNTFQLDRTTIGSQVTTYTISTSSIDIIMNKINTTREKERIPTRRTSLLFLTGLINKIENFNR